MRWQELREAKLPRRWRGNVGKSIGNSVYVHRDYETEIIPQDALSNAQQNLDGFDYNIVKYVSKTGAITFIQSPDFDSAPEPMIGNALLVKPDGTKKSMSPLSDPWIYHHKWLFVKDDYPGFGVDESKRRSASWMDLPDIDYSRIGKKSFWEKFVVPHIPDIPKH